MAPKRKNPKKGTPKKETPKQTPKKESPQLETPEKDIPKIQIPKIETLKKETPQKATSKELIPKEVPESIKSVSNLPLKEGPLNDMFPRVQVPQGRIETPTKEPSKKTSINEIPKKGIFKTGCYSCAKKETAKKVFPRNVSPEDEPPKNMFLDIGYPKKPSPNTKSPVEEFPKKASPKKNTPKSEPPKKETRTTLDDAFILLEESIAKQQKLWASLNPIMDLTQFHPLQKTMMRVFFEALCIRLGKVEELKRRISDCKDGTEYYAFPDLFNDITTHEVIWTSRTGLSPIYMKFLNDIVFLPDVCKDLIRKVPKNTRDKEDISRKEHTDEKNEKHVTFNDNAEKENVRGKQGPWERKQANSDVGQKKPLNDKTNKDVSRTNNANKQTPQGMQKVSKDEKANEDISQKHPPDKTTQGRQKETLSDKTNKGITRVDNADKDTPKEKQKVPKNEKVNVAISQKDPLEKPTKKDSTDNNNADKAPPKAKQKASKDEEANQSISPKDPSNEKTNTPTPRNVTSEEERAWEKLIPDHNHLAGKNLQPKDQFFGLIRLENISARMHNKEYARGNLFGDDTMEAPDYNAPHTAFQVIDGDTNTIHSETITFAKILLRHKDDEEGLWAGKYAYFKAIFPYVYGGWCGVGKTIEEVVGMDEGDLGRWFPKGLDFPVFGREVEVEEEEDREWEEVDFEEV